MTNKVKTNRKKDSSKSQIKSVQKSSKQHSKKNKSKNVRVQSARRIPSAARSPKKGRHREVQATSSAPTMANPERLLTPEKERARTDGETDSFWNTRSGLNKNDQQEKKGKPKSPMSPIHHVHKEVAKGKHDESGRGNSARNSSKKQTAKKKKDKENSSRRELSRKDHSKKEIVPKRKELNQKEKKIQQGKVCDAKDYMTLADVKSDWEPTIGASAEKPTIKTAPAVHAHSTRHNKEEKPQPQSDINTEPEKPAEPVPQRFALDAKAQRIKEGNIRAKNTDYPTLKDVISDWETKEQ